MVLISSHNDYQQLEISRIAHSLRNQLNERKLNDIGVNLLRPVPSSKILYRIVSPAIGSIRRASRLAGVEKAHRLWTSLLYKMLKNCHRLQPTPLIEWQRITTVIFRQANAITITSEGSLPGGRLAGASHNASLLLTCTFLPRRGPTLHHHWISNN